jgi:hypothetical protein
MRGSTETGRYRPHEDTADYDYVECEMDSTDDADTGLHAMQINRDVSDTISYAINQLQVFEMPELLYVDTTDWQVLKRTTSNIRHEDLWRYCESVTQVRSRKAHLRCATDAREANGAQLLRSAPSCACGFSAIALLLNLESSLFRTNSNNLRRIESCPLNINLRCHSP